MAARSGTTWNERIKLWPSSLPDETLFSVVSQHHALTRGSLSKQTIGPLFGKGIMLFAGGFPTGLGQLASFLQSASSIWTVDKLISDFTFVPYLQFFYSDSVLKQVCQILEGQDGRGIKTILGWVASRLGAAEPLRACSACYCDDLANYGRPYWHRAHQLPGVGVCHIHSIKLIHIPGPSEEYKRFVPLIPPEDISHRPQEVGYSLDIKFSQWSNEFLQNPPSRIDKNLLKAIYIEQLSEIGLVTRSGRVRQRELMPWLRTQFQNIRLALSPRQASTFVGKHNLNWVMKLLRKPHGTAHPAKHILLMTLLFRDIHAFRNKLETCQLQRDKCASHNGQQQTANSSINNLGYMPFVSLREWSAQTGKSVTTLAVECIRQGWPLKRRPKRLTDALMTQVKPALETGTEFDALAKRFELSLSTLYRILRAYPESQMIRSKVLFERELKLRRRNLEELLSEGVCASRQYVKNRNYKDYVWLHRHDNQWLSEFLERLPKIKPAAKKSVVDWGDRDRMMHEYMLHAYHRLISIPGKPQRVTAKALVRGFGATSWIDKHLKKLPKCTLFLQTHVETKTAFHCRRLQWAAHELAVRSMPITASGIVRYAGIRWPPNMDKDEIQVIISSVQLCPKAVRLV